MISKREKWLWIIYVVILILLFFLSSTNLLIKEELNEVDPVSIIIADSNDDYYINYKKGMDRAAMKYGADVNFITLYDQRNLDQQLELINREVQDGAKALVIAPVNYIAITKYIDDHQISIPVVLIETELSHDKIAVNIAADAYQSGRQLALAVVGQIDPDTVVDLFCNNLDYGSNEAVYDGIMSILTEHDRKSYLYTNFSTDQDGDKLKRAINLSSRQSVCVAIDQESLTLLAELIENNYSYRQQLAGLYGVGCTQTILNYLDKEIIDGIIVTNRYIEGYLSVQKAVEAIREGGSSQKITIDSIYITKDDIRKKEYEKMLYPID